MQRDSGTYCDEPEDQEDFGRFKQGFDLSAKKADIDDLVSVSLPEVHGDTCPACFTSVAKRPL